MDKTDRLRDYGLAFLLYEQGLGICGYELIRELFIFIKLILNSYLSFYNNILIVWHTTNMTMVIRVFWDSRMYLVQELSLTILTIIKPMVLFTFAVIGLGF